MKVSVTLFLSDILPHRRKIYHKIVKNKIFRNQETGDVFTFLKKIGLDGFELMLPQYATTTDADIRAVKKYASTYKFPVLSVHQSLRFLTTTKAPEIARLCEIAHMLSAKVVVLHINSARKQLFDDHYVATLHKLEKKYKVTITFENMERYFASLPYKYRWHGTKFSELVSKTDFHITFDIVHLAHSGGDIIHFYKNNKERIINIHLSDYKFHPLNASLRPMRYKHMPLGDGELPIDTFISVLQKEKYEGLVTFELHADLRGVERSISVVHHALQGRKQQSLHLTN